MILAILGASKRGVNPSFFSFPLSFEGEGDTGGEVDKQSTAHLKSFEHS